MREPQKSYVPKKGDKDVHFDTSSTFTPEINNEGIVEGNIAAEVESKNKRVYSEEAFKQAMQEYAEKLLSSG